MPLDTLSICVLEPKRDLSESRHQMIMAGFVMDNEAFADRRVLGDINRLTSKSKGLDVVRRDNESHPLNTEIGIALLRINIPVDSDNENFTSEQCSPAENIVCGFPPEKTVMLMLGRHRWQLEAL
ncbi:hypothetical protein DFH07DRAFT_771616 [Mycena maculata]|uniref:Uncharacterized protein n=1 Tax=Mycena maculata TaxID=230809 RepID=A0AAD7JCF0_9AGAR|nr:hypothetical protein DFH07DRAFT_771616 [Mycena maculata]